MTASQPLVKLYDPSDNTRYWDISPIITSVNIAYGRNQPFAVAEVVVKKAYFTSVQNYWGEVQDCPKDGSNNPELPTTYLVDGQSPIHIEAYGTAYDMCVERHESEQGSDYITLLCYNKAYKLKSATTLNSLSRIVLYNNKLYFAYDTQHSNPLSNTISQIGKATATCVLNGSDSVSFRVNVSSLSNGNVNVEYMEGTGSNIFRFIQMYGAGYSYADCICDNGYSYDYGSSIQKTYTLNQIQTIKESPVIETVESGANQEIIKLRVSSDSNFCWEALKAIGALSNRWPFFYDKAYFVDYNTASSTTQNHIDEYQYMKLDYGLDSNGNSTTYIQATQQGDKDYMDLYEIVSNADQGSTYVQTSQKVYGENYSTKVSVSDIADNHTGYELYFPYPEYDPTDISQINNYTRNFLTRKIAFNRVVQNYKPSDAVLFHISEMSNQIQSLDVEDRIYSDVSELPQSAETGQYALVISGGVLYTYYRYGGSGWTIDESATGLNDRIQKFNPYTIIDKIKDVQNGLEIENVPLAYTKLMWPSCLTELVFGNPEFMDAQQQWSALTLEAQVSTEQGTEDSLISDRYASKLVIGNQTMSELADNRQGFTGLIMEKNWDNELYRLSGYNDGVLQAYFNSKGEIMSGNGKVTINEDGITIEDGGGTIDPSLLPDAGIPEWDDTKLDYKLNDMVQWEGVLYTYVSSTPGSNVEPGTQNANTVWKQSGDVSLWSSLDTYSVGDTVIYNGKVYTCNVQTGNTNVPGDGHVDPTTHQPYWVCLVSTSDLSGSIIAQNNNILSTQSGGRTKIDSDGLKTYNSSGNLVCSVGTDGNINGIKINASQITAGTIDASTISVTNINGSNITSGTISAQRIDTQNMSIGGSAQSATNTENVGKSSATSGYVEIDQNGLRTYSTATYSDHTSSTLQCEVSTSSNGQISAGQGTVLLDKNGILIKDVSQANNQVLRFNDQWSSSSGWSLFSDGSAFYIANLSNSKFFSLSPSYGALNGIGSFTGYCGHISGAMFNNGNLKGAYIKFQPPPVQDGFKILVGYKQDLSAGLDDVSFVDDNNNYVFEFAVAYATCTTVRSTQSGDGNDYVYNVTRTGMKCRHDEPGGFYWMAIGF